MQYEMFCEEDYLMDRIKSNIALSIDAKIINN